MALKSLPMGEVLSFRAVAREMTDGRLTPPDHLTAKQIAAATGMALGSVYRMAHEHGWRRTRTRPRGYRTVDVLRTVSAPRCTVADRKIDDNRYWARLLTAITDGQVELGPDFRYYNHLPRRVADVDATVYAAEGRGWVELLADGTPKVTADGRAWLDGWLARPKAEPATSSVTPVFSGGAP